MENRQASKQVIGSWALRCKGCGNPTGRIHEVGEKAPDGHGTVGVRWAWKARQGCSIERPLGNDHVLDQKGHSDRFIDPEDGKIKVVAYGDSDFFQKLAEEFETIPISEDRRRRDEHGRPLGRSPHGYIRVVCRCGRDSQFDPVKALLMTTEREVTL